MFYMENTDRNCNCRNNRRDENNSNEEDQRNLGEDPESFQENLRNDNLFNNRDDFRRDPSNRGNRRERNCSHHTHEFLGSTGLSEEGSERHNHRFAGISSREISSGSSHFHRILINTDSFDGHFHVIEIETGDPIYIGDGKHIHKVIGYTEYSDGHRHSFIFATLIQDPLRYC